MTHAQAERTIIRAVVATDDLVALTTAPTVEQQDAIRALVLTDEAPGVVCHVFDLDSASSWSEVVRAIALRRGEHLGALPVNGPDAMIR